MLFHRHDWRLISKTYARPSECLYCKRVALGFDRQASFGVTEFLWECAKCGAIRKETLLGKEVEREDVGCWRLYQQQINKVIRDVSEDEE